MSWIVEVLKGGAWKRDRSYKVFENAENRAMTFQHQGINARLIEVKR